MARLVILVVLVVFAVWLVRRALRAPDRPSGEVRPGQGGELVRCARCGVHLPRAEATVREGELFCGDEHARAGSR